MNIKPLHDRILIRVNPAETKSPGGIVIPDTANQDNRTRTGVVEATGRGVFDQHGKFHEVSVKAGDEVLIGKYAGSVVDFAFADRLERVIVRDDDLLAIIEK
jgi:chaperonin GroES